MSARIIYAVSVAAMLSACSQATHTPPPSAAFVAATLGYEAYKDGDFATAESKFRTALVDEPDNAYALLGLGAVRENQGDVAGAIDLYSAAKFQGQDSPTRYAYITEQRLERASNVKVAVLAKNNLDRIYLKQAAQTQGSQQGFVSYDGETASVAPIQPATFATAEPYAAPPSTAPTVALTAYDLPADGNYVAVGSYESYASSLGGAVVESTDYNTGIAQADYAADVLPIEYSTNDAVQGDYSLEIEPASYTTEVITEAYDGGAAPYYDAPLSDTPLSDVPLSYEGAQAGSDLSQYQSVGGYGDVSITETYTSVAATNVATLAPAPAWQVETVSPVAPVLGYGESFGGDAGFAAPAVNDYTDAIGTPSVRDAGGLIYLGDG